MHWKALVGSKVLLLILLTTCAKSDDGEKRVVCYYTNWSVYRPGSAKFSPQNINPYLCTHLIYAFGGFTKDNTLKPFDKYQDVDKGGYAKFTGLKTYNKDLKTLLAIGGWNEGSSRFSPMVADAQRRRKFVKNVVKFLRQNHFDGLDLDWEYPAFRDGGKPRDRDNYASLVEELREEFEKESSKTGKPRLLLTMAVPAGIEYIDKGYDIPKLNEYLDFINLLSYDYHSAYEPAVNHHSPLYPLEEDNEYNYDNELTIDYTIKHLIKSGASSDKIVLGIPTYGRSYTLFNEDATALGSPADGPGAEGDATREKGYLAYYEICENLDKEEWTVEKPYPKAMGPYAYSDKMWVGYDDEDIVRAKAKYVNEKKLGGIMFWSIDNDDFRGKCHGRPYPLIEAAKEALLEDNSSRTKEREDPKPASTSTKKRNRVTNTSKSSSSTDDSKKSNSSSNRRNSLRSSTDKRSKTRSRSSSSANEKRSNDEPVDDDAEDSENIEKTISTTARSQITNKNRFRSRLNTNERSSSKKQSTRSTTKRPSGNKKVTTPEPPTTPDPGGDFKCEEEGFYPHPRDCKKYFWCLDSGPSGLGIVANQFTCPSGLEFNKKADSCDYPRNVVCPKAKAATPSTTTKRTTTEKEDVIEDDEEEEEEEEDIEEVEDDDSQIEKSKEPEEKSRRVKFTTTTTSTTARPLQYKTISRNRSTTTSTTTTSAPTSTVDSPQSPDDFTDEEQDPRVLKELIDLIKKAGGIEQLEKQLALQEKSSGSNQESGKGTPATISKSLYERVLQRQSAKSNLFGRPTARSSTSTRKTDVAVEDVDDEEEDEEEEEVVVEEKVSGRSTGRAKFVNGPGRSQFEGLEDIPEVRGLRRSNKPKYVTIERHSSSTTSSKIDDEPVEDDDEIEDEESSDSADVASSEEKSVHNVSERKPSTVQRSTPGYVNIRRTRPTTTTESVNENINEQDTTTRSQPSQSIRRHSRPTENAPRVTETKEDTTTPKTRYISANRFRSTTSAPPKEFEQTSSETIPTTFSSSSPKFIEDFSTEGKTITIAGESGKISIVPFTTDTPSTARLYSEELSPTIKSTTPYFEEKIVTTTPYTTRRVYETTLAPNTNIIDDSVTETIVPIIPTESSAQETIAAVSQPRPFGFPRRTRPTSPTTAINEATRSTVRGYESSTRSKVLDELILHHPVSKDNTVHKTISDFMTERPKKDNNFNNSFYKTGNSPKDILFTPLMTPSNENDIERVVKVPVRFVDGPDNELFFLQIPEKKLNMPGFGSVLKIEVLKNDDYNVSNVNILKAEDNNILEHDIMPKISSQKKNSSTVDTSKGNNSDTNSRIIKINVQKNENATSDFGAALKALNSVNIERKANQNAFGNFDLNLIQSAILNSQNSLVKDKQPFISNKNVSDKKKVHRQRVLIYKGSTKHKTEDNSSPGKWLMRKVIRKRIRRTGSKAGDDLETSASVPAAVTVNAPREVNPSRNPGLNLYRRQGDAQLSRGSYTSVSTATLPSTKKIYPLHFGVDTRVVGITADQSGIPQNLELILADPPAPISPSNSGEPVIIRPNFRRKISTTISPQPAEEIFIGTTPSRMISSDRRRKGHKYDSDRVASQASYQIHPRPLKPAVTDYDYYEDIEERFVGGSDGKLLITSTGLIKCLDQGNFPHPDSCKKFISCAKMVNGIVTATEYTCPDKLSFDPIGGICNWSAGIGCSE